MATNGGIRIPVELETKLIQRQLNALRERIQELDDQAEKALEIGDTDYYNRLTEQANELRREESEIVDVKLRQERQAERLSKEMRTQAEHQTTITSEVSSMSAQLEQMVSDYNLMKKQKIISEQDIEDAEQLKKDIIELVRQIEKLSGKKVTIPGITDQGGEQAKDNTRNLDFNFKKLLRSAKRLALGILGIRGAYMLARKAANAWMSTDEQKAKDMENNWVALGTILSGVIETLMKGFRKLVTGILYFMSVLTGTNYIQKANDAILKKQTKSTNELAKANQKLTASFDELNILQENSSASSGEDNTTGSLIDINDIGEKARAVIEKIATALKPVYDMIKGIVEWAIEHPEVIAGILGGATLLTFLGKVLGFAGVGGAVGTGLAGILGVLLGIAALGVITVCIKTIYEEGGKLKEETKNNTETSKELTKTAKETSATFKEKLATENLDAEAVQKLTTNEKNLATTNYQMASSLKKTNKEAGALEQTINVFTGHLNENSKQQQEATTRLIEHADNLRYSGEMYGWTEETMADYKETLNQIIEVTEVNSTVLEAVSAEEELFGKKIDGTGSSLEKQIYWNRQARAQLLLLDEKTDGSTTFLDKFKQKIDEINGKKVSVDLEVNTNMHPISDKIISIGNILKLPSFISLGYNLKSIGLAKGGIANHPGTGIPTVGNGARWAEAGTEAYLPLTDEQVMSTLGENIGKHITIPLTVINQMNGRTISRELKQIEASSDFAYNR